MEWIKKYRPKSFKEVVGQEGAIQVLQSFIKSNTLPHSIMFSGQTGGGKTTLARILKGKLNCSDMCYEEINVADSRGIDKIRDIQSRISGAPVGGTSRIWVLDEAHRLTGDAQAALLKTSEDTPSHVYLVICTTDPEKLLKALRDRFTRIEIKPVNYQCLRDQIFKVLDKEEMQYPSDDVVDKIIEVADGSVRSAISILERVMQRKTPEEMLQEAENHNAKEQAIMIAKLLMQYKPKPIWKEMAKVLNGVDEDPESLRHMVLAYASKVLLGGGPAAGRAYLVIEAFEENFFNSKRAGLIKACYDVIHG